MKTIATALLTVFLASTVAQIAHAHGGGLNKEGCHNNRKTGGYHCH
ncbi:YHYH domain-containing protein [Rhizobiaceae bacterium]|nr:YHYH domain-containing protein [Rhizobiaceae bacterium]